MNQLNQNFEQLVFESDEEIEEADESNETNEIEIIEEVNNSVLFESDKEEVPDVSEEIWSSTIQKPQRWHFEDDKAGVNIDLVGECKTPADYYNLFINDTCLELIATETNRYALNKEIGFNPTTKDEIQKLLALFIQMGYVTMPTLDDYWSNDISIGGHAICASIMTKNRFKKLMRCLHFCNNDDVEKIKLYKIQKFVDLFIQQCQLLYRPMEKVCINESLIPFSGRISFRQYIPNKRYKYGLKLFKLCTCISYTYNLAIYCGKEQQPTKGSVAENMVLKLMNGLENQGRTLYTDNWYTSVRLAKTLLQKKTNLIGTVRKNRGFIKDVITVKLKKEEHIAQQDNQGIIQGIKWQDKREVLMLSTVYDDSKTDNKPEVIVDYNHGKTYIDISDQLASYSPYLRKTYKWYMQIFFHITCQIAVVNALKLYEVQTGKKINIVQFRKEIMKGLLKINK